MFTLLQSEFYILWKIEASLRTSQEIVSENIGLMAISTTGVHQVFEIDGDKDRFLLAPNLNKSNRKVSSNGLEKLEICGAAWLPLVIAVHVTEHDS